jgi:hypothetical protein
MLVTGAGFEIKAGCGGFGLPATKMLLEAMGEPFGTGEPGKGNLIPLRRCEQDEAPRFPIPYGGIWEDQDRSDYIAEAAVEQDLDAYWDVLLGEELRSKVGSSARHEVRELRKAHGLILETRMREAFRLSLLDHDWGHMNQSIAAARLGWNTWLTTNYTQFANRAITVANGTAGLGPWRIVSTAREARVTLREELRAQGPAMVRRGGKEPRNRYLFKLHGDIGHLHTMAIAGQDKDSFSHLSMPMDDLYQVYASAQQFLLDLFDGLNEDVVMWHIVGHGLQDKRLRDLIGRVSRQSRAAHRFLLVNPGPEKPRERLAGALNGDQDIWSCPLYAADYMARLESDGLPSLEALPDWLEKMAGLGKETGEKATVKG